MRGQDYNFLFLDTKLEDGGFWTGLQQAFPELILLFFLMIAASIS